MVQEILVWLLFAAALAYIGKLLYSNFKPSNKGCAKGCSSCALDINKIEEQMKKAEAQSK